MRNVIAIWATTMMATVLTSVCLSGCSSNTNQGGSGADGFGGSTSHPSGSAGAGGSSGGSSGQGGASGSQPTGGSGGAGGTRAGTFDASTGSDGSAGSPIQDGGSASTDADASEAGSGEEKCNKVIPSSMDCTAPIAPGDERTCMIGTRSYIIYAGKTMNPCKPVPVVFDAHGATETAKQQAGEDQFCSGTTCWHGLGSGWKAEADTPGGGFIAVFGQGVNNLWSASDADYFLQILDEVKKVTTVDPKKVYISGISNGGAVTYETGCPHSDVFHGMSPNAGGDTCSGLKQPIPVIAFDDEPDFAYQGSVDAMNSAVKANNCKGTGKDWLTVDKTYPEAVCRSAKEDTKATLIPCTQVTEMIEPTKCTVYDQCDGDVKVVFCLVAANTEHGSSNAALDGHIIYENNTLLNTPSLAWRFFKQFW